ncbi:MAG: dUTP diphosphatase [Hyphomicrobiaceae bacterium]|nr:dUTP diphosphatase [Hyphomicrobiaceae bacterium]
MKKPLVKVMRLSHSNGLALPAYQSKNAAGMDLVAAVPEDAPIRLKARGGTAMIPTGLVLQLPVGCEAQVRPRSGLAAKHGITVLNSPGTIDADYRGEVQVILINHGPKPFVVRRGERIAQMVIAPVTTVRLAAAQKLTSTARGASGFGSTGGAAALEKNAIAPVSEPTKPALRAPARKKKR